MRKEIIKKLCCLCMEINGLSARERVETGELPTVFFTFRGHIGVFEISVHMKGWIADQDPDMSWNLHTDCERFEIAEYEEAYEALLAIKERMEEEAPIPRERGVGR